MSIPSISERVRFLQQNVYERGGSPATPDEISAAVRQRGYSLSSSTIRAILAGHVHQPSQATLTALADYFLVPVSTFGDDPREWEKVHSFISQYRQRIDASPLAASRAWQRLRKKRFTI